MKGWYGDKYGHRLASMGVRTREVKIKKIKPPFNRDELHDYVVAHDDKPPTEKEYIWAEQFYNNTTEEEGDYAKLSAEIVFRRGMDDWKKNKKGD